MGPIEYAAVVATIIAGIAAVYAILFGSRPLVDVFTKWWANRRQKNRPNEIKALDDEKAIVHSDHFVAADQQIHTMSNIDASAQEADMTDEAGKPAEELAKLRQNLVKHFNNEELNTLSFDLGVDYELLPGDSKEAKARELILYLERRGGVDELIKKCYELRPKVSWEEMPESTRERVPQSTRFVLGIEVDRFDDEVGEIKRLVREGKYVQAVSYAKEQRNALIEFGDQDNLRFLLTFAEFDVWYAHALMYTGETWEAVSKLEDVIVRLEDPKQPYKGYELESRWHLVLGRAHNHIGYINWMDLGHYEFALDKFRTAIRHCMAAKTLARQPSDELATAYDNMGRVYAQLGYRTRAELLIEHGRQMRHDLPDITRRALSLNSRAIVHLAFGEPGHASVVSKMALSGFEEHHNNRGIGLALLTKGCALRYLASYTYFKDSDPKINHERLKQAENDLVRAWKIFEEIGEWVRLFQVYNELGCARRERARLLKREGDTAGALRVASAATEFLERSVDIAKGHDPNIESAYPTHYVDACVDLAETYLLVGNRNKANEWVECAEKVVPSEYLLDARTATEKIEPTECFEDLWQQLGKVAALRGHMAYEDSLDEAVKYYTLAAGYFGRFLERPLSSGNRYLYPPYRPQLTNHRIFIEHLYDRLKDLQPKQWQDIRGKISDLERTYGIQHSWLKDFYSDTLYFLLDVNIIDDWRVD
jgi:tetratricopeptide (TPR) repeat protein